MTIYLIVDNTPWDSLEIVAARFTRKQAEDYIVRRKAKDAYTAQYYEVQKLVVRGTRK